jgi:hypothetical protein
MFKRAGSVQQFFRNAVNTKVSHDTKLEGVIQRPPEYASDQQRAEFRKILLKELGAVENPEDYGFSRPTLPEGMQYDEAMDKAFSQLFAKIGLPKDMANELRNAFIDSNIRSHNDRVKAENEAFETEVNQFNTKYPGEQAAVMARAAHDILMKKGSDDITTQDGQVIKGLKTLIKEADLYNNPTNFESWRKVGFSPNQLSFLGSFAEETSGGRNLPGQGGPGGKPTDPNAAFVAAANAGSPELANAAAQGE